MKRKKNENAALLKQITGKIPYLRVFEEEGIFESAPGVYSKAYMISDITTDDIMSVSNELITKRFGMLLNNMPEGMSMQFLIHNRLIAHDAFLERVLMAPNKEDEVNTWIEKYNSTVTENSTIGHNNVKKNKYFVLSIRADLPEIAVNSFREEDEHIKELFRDVCNIKIDGLSVTARLKIMYSMFNPKENEFAKKAKMKDDGGFSLRHMKKQQLTTKEIIAPQLLDDSNKNYMVFNNDTYVRVFFISSLPSYVSNNLISDITNISSNMIFSAVYEPVDSEYGFMVATKCVSDNTIVKQQAKRDTIKDRKDKTMVRIETMVEENETHYFERSALDLMRESVAARENAMLATFVIVLYADDIETLERDTKLLHISTSKFACQIKPLDLQQLQGFQSALPLAFNRIDCRRVFSIHKLAQMPPLNLQEILQKDGLFNGLNSFNDNLVLLNRKNNPILSGIIAGTEHSGKTFQNKREIFNSLISTYDKVVVISNTDDYDGFITTLGGVIYENVRANPFDMVEHYGLISPDKYSKSLMIEALTEILTRPTEKIIATRNMAEMAGHENITLVRYDEISDEVKSFINKTESAGIDWKDQAQAVSFIEGHREDFPHLSAIIPFVRKTAFENETVVDNDERLQLYKFKTDVELTVLLDLLFNQQIRDKIDNITTWIYADSMDGLFDSEQTLKFILDYVERMNALQNIFTTVIQSSVKLFTDSNTSSRLADFVDLMGYYKLLNQGAIERKKYTELLNIPNSLVNYITSAELGKGIICTPASNTAFDDSFYIEEDDGGADDFYSLFKL